MLYLINFIWQLVWSLIADLLSLIFRFTLSYSGKEYWFKSEYNKVLYTDYRSVVISHFSLSYKSKYHAIFGINGKIV
jgi:hypothetical protein